MNKGLTRVKTSAIKYVNEFSELMCDDEGFEEVGKLYIKILNAKDCDTVEKVLCDEFGWDEEQLMDFLHDALNEE